MEKTLPSAFSGTDLAGWIAAREIDTLTVVGYMTHNCIASTVQHALHAGLAVEVLYDATGSVSYANRAGKASATEIHQAFSVVLQMAHKVRDLALFNLAIDSKLRGCDLVGLRMCDVSQGTRVPPRAMVMQQKTKRAIQFEITEQTRNTGAAWIEEAHLGDTGQFPILTNERTRTLERPLSVCQPTFDGSLDFFCIQRDFRTIKARLSRCSYIGWLPVSALRSPGRHPNRSDPFL